MTISQRTKAETALLEQFKKFKHESLLQSATSNVGFLPGFNQREKAIQTLEQFGLPTRKLEAWHYTDLRRYLTKIPAIEQHEESEVLPPLLKDAKVISINNGQVNNQQEFSSEGLKIVPLSASQSEEDFSVLQEQTRNDSSNIVGDINTAFVQNGWHIDVIDHDVKSHTIELQNIQNGGQSYSRFPIHIGQNARVTLIERQTGNDKESFISFVSELKLAKGAEVNWIILRDRGLSSTELNRLSALLGEGAKLTLYIVNAGGKLLRQEVNVDLVGENSNFQLRGINLLSGKSHSDVTMVVRHLVENTDSSEILRNVVTEEAQGVFQGMIRVAKEAQKTDAKMACNSLILSEKAEFNAKPELEIFADDVACGHGATVAEIDHNHLFYLMARGIPEGEARSLLVKAFVNELIEELPEELATTLHSTLEIWLQNHFFQP